MRDIQKTYNKRGKRKGLICFSISDIAKKRGVTNAAVRKARERGILDIEDAESVYKYMLNIDKLSSQEIVFPIKEKPGISKSMPSGINLSQIMRKTKAKKSKAEIKEKKLEIGIEIIGYIKDKMECPSMIWKQIRDFDIPDYEVSDERLCIGNIDPQEMKFGDRDYEEKWARIWAPLYGEEQPD